MVTRVRLREKIKPHAARIRGIAHPHRLSILYLLCHDALDVRDIVAHVDLPENLVSHHLKQMLLSGWVTKTRTGRRVTYQLQEKAFRDIYAFLSDTPFVRNLLGIKRGAN